MNRLLEFWRYTKSLPLMFKLIFSFFLTHLGMIFKQRKLVVAAEKIVCNRPHILRTPFGNYLAVSLLHYCVIINNYEPTIKNVIKKIAKDKNNDDYLINIGCSIGRYAIGLAKEYGYNVIAFEPNPETFHNLQINTLLSDLENKFELFNVGLGDKDEELSFAMGNTCDTGSHIVDNNDVHSNGNSSQYDGTIIKVPVRKFDDLGIEKEKIKKTRLVIMDVEGFELYALRGMEKTLKEFSDISIILEIWKDHKNKQKTLDYMKSLGYKAKEIDGDNRLLTK